MSVKARAFRLSSLSLSLTESGLSTELSTVPLQLRGSNSYILSVIMTDWEFSFRTIIIVLVWVK